MGTQEMKPTSEWKDFKRELMQDPEFVAEFEELAPEYELAKSILALRLRRGLSQQELAGRVSTTRETSWRFRDAIATAIAR